MHVATPAQWVVVISVLGGMIALYLATGFLLIRPFISPQDRIPKLGPTGLLVFIATIFSFACIFYAWKIEPYQLEVTHHRLPIEGLPAKACPIRIVQISDLHCDKSKRLEDELPQVIAAEKPDVIFYTGDSANSVDGIPIFHECIHKIMSIAPTYAVKGDWDFSFPEHDVLGTSGVEIVTNKVITVRGANLRIAGTESRTQCKAVLEMIPKDMPIIFLFHTPDADFVMDDTIHDIALYCCGHTHGGQIALPVYGALITQSLQGKRYESGLHRVNKTWLYVNRGIGMEGHFPRLRFFARPEVSVFELVPAE